MKYVKERQRLYDLTYMWNLREKKHLTTNRLAIAKSKEWKEGNVGEGDQKLKCPIVKM